VVDFTLAQPWVWWGKGVLVGFFFGFDLIWGTYFLEDGGEDEAVVYEGDFGAVLDCVVNALDVFVTGVYC
jgi:hypothetical protein